MSLVQMEGMVTDLQLAREKQQAFETWQRQNSKSSPLDLSVTVLTTGFWPAFKVHNLHMHSYQCTVLLRITLIGKITVPSRDMMLVSQRRIF